MNGIIETLCDALGRKPPRLTLPAGLVRRLAGVLEDGARSCGVLSPIVRATIDKYTEDVAVDGQRFRATDRFCPPVRSRFRLAGDCGRNEAGRRFMKVLFLYDS